MLLQGTCIWNLHKWNTFVQLQYFPASASWWYIHTHTYDHTDLTLSIYIYIYFERIIQVTLRLGVCNTKPNVPISHSTLVDEPDTETLRICPHQQRSSQQGSSTTISIQIVEVSTPIASLVKTPWERYFCARALSVVRSCAVLLHMPLSSCPYSCVDMLLLDVVKFNILVRMYTIVIVCVFMCLSRGHSFVHICLCLG